MKLQKPLKTKANRHFRRELLSLVRLPVPPRPLQRLFTPIAAEKASLPPGFA
jgi:hypothetical protein